MTTATPERPAAWPFLIWAVVGAGASLAVLTVFSIGILVLPLVITAASALLLWRVSRTIAAVGTISGLGMVPLYVAYLNRGGPGTVCHNTAGGQACMSELSPWPWLAAGLILVAVGIAGFWLLRARTSR